MAGTCSVSYVDVRAVEGGKKKKQKPPVDMREQMRMQNMFAKATRATPPPSADAYQQWTATVPYPGFCTISCLLHRILASEAGCCPYLL